MFSLCWVGYTSLTSSSVTYTPLTLEHQQNSLKGGICQLPICGSWSESLQHRIKCPSLIYSLFCPCVSSLPPCLPPCAMHSWVLCIQAPHQEQGRDDSGTVPWRGAAPQIRLGKSRGTPGSCRTHTEGAGRATTAKGSLWNSPVICWIHSWIQFSAWSLHSSGHSPAVLRNVLLLKPENYRMWYMAVSEGFHAFDRKRSSNFTSFIAVLVQVPTLGSAVLSKQTSAPSWHSGL